MYIELITALIVPIAFLVACRKVKWIIWAIWLWYLGFAGLAYYCQISYRIYMIGVGMNIGLLGYCILGILRHKKDKRVMNYFLFILLVFAYMLTTNQSGFSFVGIKGAFELLQFPLFAGMIALVNPKISLKNLLKASYILLLIQAAAVFLQWRYFSPTRDALTLAQDTYNGIFGGYGTGSVTPILISMTGAILAMYIFSKGVKFQYIVALGLLLVPLVIAEGKAGFAGYTFALGSYILLFILGKVKFAFFRKMRRAIVIVFLFSIFLFIGARIYSWLGYGNIREYFSGEVIEYLLIGKPTTQGTLPRWKSFVRLVKDSSSTDLWFGKGSGSSLSSTLLGTTSIFQEMNRYYGIASRVLNRVIFETGIIGLILIVIILILAYKNATGGNKSNLTDAEKHQTTCVKVLFLVFMMFCCANYTQMLSNQQIGVFFWTIIGVAMSSRLKKSLPPIE